MERSDDDLADGVAGSAATPRRERSAADELLMPGEVAQLFGVDPKTVSRWADTGRLDALRTLGGHRRYRARQVHALLDEAGS